MSSPEGLQLKVKETQPKKGKPFTLVLLRHGPEDIDGLTTWSSAVVDMLDKTQDKHPKSKVVVFTESANTTPEMATIQTELFESGERPINAVVESWVRTFEDRGNVEGGEELLRKQIKSQLLEASFTVRKYMLLELLAQTYPGRIRWVPERVSQEQIIEADAIERMVSEEVLAELPYQELGAHIRNHKFMKAKILREREERAASLLTMELAENDVVGGVGQMGEFHTGLSIALHKMGHSVKRTFDRKEGRNFYFTPTHSIVRELRFHPDTRLTEDDQPRLDALLQATLDVIEYKDNTPAGQRVSDQVLFAYQYERLRGERRVENNPKKENPESILVYSTQSSVPYHQPELDISEEPLSEIGNIDWAGDSEIDSPERTL